MGMRKRKIATDVSPSILTLVFMWMHPAVDFGSMNSGHFCSCSDVFIHVHMCENCLLGWKATSG